MKSELYHTIARIAIFCIVAALGLTLGGIYVAVRVTCGQAVLFQRILAYSVIALGILLWTAAIWTAVHFNKRYKIAAAEEEKQRRKLQEAEAVKEGRENGE